MRVQSVERSAAIVVARAADAKLHLEIAVQLLCRDMPEPVRVQYAAKRLEADASALVRYRRWVSHQDGSDTNHFCISTAPSNSVVHDSFDGSSRIVTLRKRNG